MFLPTIICIWLCHYHLCLVLLNNFIEFSTQESNIISNADFFPDKTFFSFRFFLVISSFLHFCTSSAYFRQGLWLVAALCIIGCCFKINTNYVKWHNWHNNVQCNKRTDRFYCLFFHTGHQPENHMVGNPIVYISVIVCLREHLFVILGVF